MAYLSAILLIFSVILFLLGLINPNWAMFFNKEKPTRKSSSLIYGSLMVISFILLAITVPKPQKNNSIKKDPEQKEEFILGENEILLYLEEVVNSNKISKEEIQLISSNISSFDSIVSKKYSTLFENLEFEIKPEKYFVDPKNHKKITSEFHFIQTLLNHKDLEEIDFIKTQELFEKCKSPFENFTARYNFYGPTNKEKELEETVKKYLYETTPNNRAFKMLSFHPTKEKNEKGFICVSEYETYNQINKWKVENYSQVRVKFISDSMNYQVIEEISKPNFDIPLLK